VLIDGHRRCPVRIDIYGKRECGRRSSVVVRRWTGEKLTFACGTGDFAVGPSSLLPTVARPGFAIGVEFLEPKGRWVVQSPR